MIHNEKINIRYYETDQMGIVHHSNYIRYFEIARVGLLDSIGLSFSEFEKLGYNSPVLSVSSNYHYACRFGDTINVKTYISKFNGIRIFFNYEITNQDNKILCTGESSHTFCDKNLKPIAMKKIDIDRYNKLIQATEK